MARSGTTRKNSERQKTMTQGFELKADQGKKQCNETKWQYPVSVSKTLRLSNNVVERILKKK